MKELLLKRATIFEQARAIALKAETEQRSMTPEEIQEYDRRMVEVKALGETIERSRMSADMAAQFQGSVGPRQDGNTRIATPGSDLVDAALDSFLRGGSRSLTPEQSGVFGRAPQGDGITFNRAASPLSANYTTGQAAGAATIPQGFVSNLETALLAYAGPRQFANVIRTAAGNPLPWPTMNDTGNTGEIIGENTAINQATTEMAFSSVTLNAYKYSSKLVLVPIELLQDSAFDVQAFVANSLGVRLGRIQNTHFTTGDGSSKPYGFVTAGTSAFTSAAPTALTYDEFVDLEHSVDPAYRINAGWAFNDSTAKFLEKLKDNNGRPLLNDSFGSIQREIKAGDVKGTAPMRYTLKGYPVYICTAMDSIAATKKPVAFGALEKYVVRDVLDLMLVRFSELYMGSGQIGFTAFMRSDANLMDAGTHPVKYITTHA